MSSEPYTPGCPNGHGPMQIARNELPKNESSDMFALNNVKFMDGFRATGGMFLVRVWYSTACPEVRLTDYPDAELKAMIRRGSER